MPRTLQDEGILPPDNDPTGRTLLRIGVWVIGGLVALSALVAVATFIFCGGWVYFVHENNTRPYTGPITLPQEQPKKQ